MLSYTCDCKAPLGVGARLLRDQHDGRCNLGVLRDRQNEALTVSWDDGQTAMYSACDSASLRVYEPGACGTSVSDRFTCSECANLRISAIRWKCTNTGCKSKSITLCSQCYHGDLHDLSHTFRRVLVEPKVNMNLNLNLNPSRSSSLPLSWRASQQEAQTVTGERLYRRQGSRKVALQGVVPGAEVTRGLDWRWSDQDGGATGTVTGRDSWFDEADGVRVQWQWQRGGESKKYRMGCNGKTDVRMVRASPTPQYAYVDHLAPVDQHMIELWKRGDRPEDSCGSALTLQLGDKCSGQPATFTVGDLVRVPTHMHATEPDSGCSGRCLRSLGSSGSVARINQDGSVLVNVNNVLLSYNPAVLTLLQSASSANESETFESCYRSERLAASVTVLLGFMVEQIMRSAAESSATSSSLDSQNNDGSCRTSDSDKRSLQHDRDVCEVPEQRKKRARLART